MNTKKFIKRVNKLYGYRCEPDTEDTFFIQFCETNFMQVDILNEVIASLECCAFDVDNGADRKLLKLLRKYLSSAESWKKPQLEWFKRGLNDDMA